MIRKLRQPLPRSRLLALGGTVAVIIVVGLVIAFNRQAIMITLKPGETISADFARDHRLRAYTTEVKVAGVPVGVVTDVQPDHGTIRVSMKLDEGTAPKLGTNPTAVIRPTTLLGGKYYVELVPGGGTGELNGAIPASRTRIASELDATLEPLQPDARRGIQQAIGQTDALLGHGGKDAARDLVQDAPNALQPTGPTLEALRGQRPNSLSQVISGVHSTSRVLNEQRGQLDSIVDALHRSTEILDRQRAPVADTVGQLPPTLRSTQAGLDDLRGTLDRLTATAEHDRPAVQQLGPVLDRLNPVLVKARPLATDLRGLLSDARPTIDRLSPVSTGTQQVLDDVRGPVLDRINGPILTALNTPYRGTGRYAGDYSPHPLFKDIAYAFTNANSAGSMTDKNGATLDIQVGANPGALQDFKGLPDLEAVFQHLLSMPGAQR